MPSKENLKFPSNELDEELADFLKHCQSNPGRSYKVGALSKSWFAFDFRCLPLPKKLTLVLGHTKNYMAVGSIPTKCLQGLTTFWQANRVEHKLLLLKALKSPDLRLMWRSDVEAFTQHRYITATRSFRWWDASSPYGEPSDFFACCDLFFSVTTGSCCWQLCFFFLFHDQSTSNPISYSFISWRVSRNGRPIINWQL